MDSPIFQLAILAQGIFVEFLQKIYEA